jgi:uroporphyrinogen-III synthase
MTRVLVTRAREDAERTAIRLRELGHAPLLSPILEIVATGARIPQGSYDAVLATSAKGLEHAQGDLGALRAITLHCVGMRTARAAEAFGWRPSLVAGNAKALLPLLRARYREPARFLYLAGRDRQDELENALRDAGHIVTVVETYEARAASALTEEAIKAIETGTVDAALHYSRRSAEIFLALARAAGPTEKLRGFTHLALSADVATPLEQELGITVHVAEKPDEEHLLQLLAAQREAS